jgi:ArsR family transcriptional regulator
MTPAISARRTDAAKAARLFHALSDETRVAALQMLRGGEKCVCVLQDELGAAQSRLSFHLKVLKDAGLVTDRREGRWAYYAIAPDALQVAHDVVRELATATKPSHTAAPPAPVKRGLRVLGACCG